MPGNDKIEFKITKDEQQQDVNLTAMSLQAAEAFRVLLNSALNIVNLSVRNPAVTLSIQKGSAKIVIEGAPRQIGQIKRQFTSVIRRESADRNLVKEWRSLQDLVQANGLHYEFNFIHDNQKENITAEITTAKKFRTKRKVAYSTSSLEFLTGRLIEVGGKSPNIHVDGPDGNKITISCTEKNARKANAFLYDPIYISVWTKTRGQDTEYELCDSYFQKDMVYFNRFRDFITRYRSLPIVAGLKELHFECRKYLDERDYNYLRKFLRLFIHESTDINILQTILILLRPFEEHERLASSIKNMRELFDKQVNDIKKRKK